MTLYRGAGRGSAEEAGGSWFPLDRLTFHATMPGTQSLSPGLTTLYGAPSIALIPAALGHAAMEEPNVGFGWKADFFTASAQSGS